jgi:hypothetical protein
VNEWNVWRREHPNLRPGLESADLHGLTPRGVNLARTTLDWADLSRADLTGASFAGAKLYGAHLEHPTLDKADFAEPRLDGTHLARASLRYADRRVASAFGGDMAKVYATRNVLREEHGLLPILFDFAPSANRNLTETLRLLASMCRFVIADLTGARRIPQELSHIVPNFPSVPVQPIILASQRGYGMLEHWRQFRSVLPEYPYADSKQLLENFETAVFHPIENGKGKVQGQRLSARAV